MKLLFSCVFRPNGFIILAFFWLARAREDTETIDRKVKKKAERLQRIATVCAILTILCLILIEY